jgi:RNA polymerase sigma-B factor
VGVGAERSDEQVNRLFRRVRDGDAGARDELVQLHLGMAYALARRYAGGVEPTEDLRQVAALALVNAVDRFDPELGRAFSTFAVPTILGELKRHFRDHAWTLHVNRATKELALRIRQARTELEKAGQPVSVPALAQLLDVGAEQVLEALQASDAQYAVSYDAPAGDDDGDAPARTLASRLSTVDPGYARVEDRDLFERVAGLLDARSRLVLELYYTEELSQQQIGERLGVSQMQVSRILRQAIDRARRQIADPDGAAE